MSRRPARYTQADIRQQAWLETVLAELRPWFEQAGYMVPKVVRIEAKHLSGLSGQHVPALFDDFDDEIYVNPTTEDDAEIIGIVAHELVHAVLPAGLGHGKEFRKCALSVGLEGLLTCTSAGPRLRAWARDFINRYGPYPRATFRQLLSQSAPDKAHQ